MQQVFIFVAQKCEMKDVTSREIVNNQLCHGVTFIGVSCKNNTDYFKMINFLIL